MVFQKSNSCISPEFFYFTSYEWIKFLPFEDVVYSTSYNPTSVTRSLDVDKSTYKLLLQTIHKLHSIEEFLSLSSKEEEDDSSKEQVPASSSTAMTAGKESQFLKEEIQNLLKKVQENEKLFLQLRHINSKLIEEKSRLLEENSSLRNQTEQEREKVKGLETEVSDLKTKLLEPRIEEECCVCLTKRAEMVTSPCGHCCLCEKDFRNLKKKASQTREKMKCPLCLVEIEKYVKKFICLKEDEK